MATTILYAPVLGQSNAKMMSLLDTNRDSGINHLQKGLEAQAGFTKVFTLQKYSDGNYKNLAVGGSTVDGNTRYNSGNIWWYPDDNKPGPLLLDAVKVMQEQFASLKTQGSVTPVVIWGQGESEASYIGGAGTQSTLDYRTARYMEATREVFDYIKAKVSSDIDFYIMETGRYSSKGAFAAGQTQATIDRVNKGLVQVDKAQHALADKYDDIFMGVDYDDLPMRAEVSSSSDPNWKDSWKTDVWHYSQKAYEIIGDRLADAISDTLNASGEILPPDPANVTTGTSGNDILIAGRLDVTMIGLAGADTFRFTATSPGGYHVVKDFHTNEGDKIDIKKVLIGFDRLTEAIADFVHTRDAGSDLVVSVDRDGRDNGASFIDLMVLRNVDTFDATYALAHKQLVA